tara:strand:+ start:19 stop:1332 length:1314 start_codon:yes stop_codon:yes gene_type:complete
MAIRYRLPSENAFDRLMNVTIPGIINQQLAANERQADRESRETIQTNLLNERQADRESRNKRADDEFSLRQNQIIEQDKDRDRQYKLEREKQTFLETQTEKTDRYNTDISAISVIEKTLDYDSRLAKAGSMLSSGSIKSPRAIARLEGIISDIRSVTGSREAEISTALEIGIIDQKAYDSMIGKINSSDDVYNKSYQIIMANEIDKASQPRKLAYNDYQTINKQIASLSTTALTNAQKLESVQPGSVKAVQDQILALQEQKKTIKQELFSTEESSSEYKYSPNTQKVINQMGLSGEIDETILGTLNTEETEELEQYLLLRKAGGEPKPKPKPLPQYDPNTPITGMQIMPQEQPETKQLGFIPSGEFSGEQLNAGRLRKIITQEFNQNRIAESRGLNRVSSEEYTFATNLAKQLGFSSAEELNSEPGIKALRKYYRSI